MKKIMLAATAICALAAFAVPATASAVATHHFTDDTAAIPSGGVDVTLHGEMTFLTIFSGISCEVTTDLKVTTNDAHVVGFTPDTDSCEGSGILDGCVLEDHEVTVNDAPLSASNPITVTILGNTDLTVGEAGDELELHIEFDDECFFGEVTLTFESLYGESDFANGGNNRYLEAITFDHENPENEGLLDAGGLESPTTLGGKQAPTDPETISIATVEG